MQRQRAFGSGTAGAVAGGAIAGAAGSIAGQAVGIATGVQEGFDWKGVAMGALGGAVSAGLGGFGQLAGEALHLEGAALQYGSMALEAIASSTLSQGVAVLTGLQEKFSWREVATAAIAAPIAGYVGGKVGAAVGGSAQRFASNFSSNLTSAAVRVALGGKVDTVSVIVDAFGNALGNSIVDMMDPRSSALSPASGESADEIPEVDVIAQRPGSESEVDPTRFNNNPIDVIRIGSNLSPDAIAAMTSSPVTGVIETVVSTAPRWRVGEENHYWTQQFTHNGAFHQFMSEDDATRTAANLFQQDIRDHVAAIQRRDALMLLNDLTPVGTAVGMYNLGIKMLGGVASTLPAMFQRGDTARSWQDKINEAQIHLPSGVGEMMRPGLNSLHSWSERNLGDGWTTTLGAGLEFGADLLVMVPGARALRSATAEVQMLNRPLQSPLYADLQQGAVAYSGLPIGVRSPFAPQTVATPATSEFVGPLFGRSGFASSGEFAEASLAKYQRYVDDAYDAAILAESKGQLKGNPNTRVGNFVDRASAARYRRWLASEGIAEGPGALVQTNRWLRDPTGSGLYVRPDIRIPAAGVTLDATVGLKWATDTQIMRFNAFSGGDRIVIVRPQQLGGSYSIVN